MHYRHSLDAKAYNDDQEQLAEERSMRVGTRPDGCVLISGLLDPVGGAAVRNALEPLARPSGAHDTRSREQRMADAFVERVTADARAKPRLHGSLRKARNLRDRHCQWPGCERPASYRDGHHLVHWAHGGATDLDNLVLLCKRHHRMVHEGGWRLIKTDDGPIIVIAPTITFGLPRGPD